MNLLEKLKQREEKDSASRIENLEIELKAGRKTNARLKKFVRGYKMSQSTNQFLWPKEEVVVVAGESQKEVTLQR